VSVFAAILVLLSECSNFEGDAGDAIRSGAVPHSYTAGFPSEAVEVVSIDAGAVRQNEERMPAIRSGELEPVFLDHADDAGTALHPTLRTIGRPQTFRAARTLCKGWNCGERRR
jgi:hypothetical protein